MRNEIIRVEEIADENWLFILLGAYKKLLFDRKECPDINEILFACIYHNQRICYDEIYNLSFEYNDVCEACIVLNLWFSINGKEYGNAQNELLTKYGEHILKLGDGK